jgi:hypothetical protein
MSAGTVTVMAAKQVFEPIQRREPAKRIAELSPFGQVFWAVFLALWAFSAAAGAAALVVYTFTH